MYDWPLSMERTYKGSNCCPISIFFNLFILILWIIVLYYSRGPRIMIKIYCILFCETLTIYCDVLGYGAENLFSSMTATTVPDKVKFPLFKFFIYLHFYKVNKSNYYCVWSRFKIYIKVRKIFLRYIKFNR